MGVGSTSVELAVANLVYSFDWELRRNEEREMDMEELPGMTMHKRSEQGLSQMSFAYFTFAKVLLSISNPSKRRQAWRITKKHKRSVINAFSLPFNEEKRRSHLSSSFLTSSSILCRIDSRSPASISSTDLAARDSYSEAISRAHQ
ncbi:hypothetical protein ACMD2_20907 [Ananas comosus]|uniref:Uncharacterized protein n=1 Tax=Ananas comosus TaxID=4615 RepID=A0A199UEN2_ANACO|nr:hypothetical protein ACMD2_20907 [Ananas comosus]